MEDPQQLSAADAAQHALLVSRFRHTMQSSPPRAAAGRASFKPTTTVLMH